MAFRGDGAFRLVWFASEAWSYGHWIRRKELRGSKTRKEIQVVGYMSMALYCIHNSYQEAGGIIPRSCIEASAPHDYAYFMIF
jgi:hypothetical protein